MKHHQDWEKAKQRFTDLWENKPTKIPYIGIRAKKEKIQDWPPQPVNDEDYWLDPFWNVQKNTIDAGNQYWIGETIPGQILLAGWLCSLGGRPEFNRQTIWFEPFPEIDFSKPSPFRHDPDDPWFLKFKRLFEAVVKTAVKEEFGVAAQPGMPANDLLSMHMGTDNYLIATMDHPEWIREAIIQGAEDQLKVKVEFMEFAEKYIGDLCYCGVGWMPLWSPKPYLRTQSDVSCMLSPEMFEQFVLPELEIYGKKFPLWYHLDGGNAKQHLPILLSLPYLRFIQYVPMPSEPRNGIEHLEFYKQVQAAGKIVHIAVSADLLIEEFIKELDPSKTLIDSSTETLAQAEDLLAKVAKWSE
jgi:hypothetical protein